MLRRLLSLLIVALPLGAHGDTVAVAVASNFAAPMQAIAAAFQRHSGHTARLSFGSSGKFFAQISHGAPFDIFLSADQSKPLALDRAALTVPDTRVTYALGALVLWSVDDTVFHPSGPSGTARQQQRQIRALLAGDTFQRLAIANPRLAPYGEAATQVMEKLGVEAAVADKLVMGENIAQTFQFVSSGNAELGFVARAQVTRDGALSRGAGWPVPAALHTPIRQDAVLLKRAADKPAARALLAFLTSDAARKIIGDYGYGLPK